MYSVIDIETTGGRTRDNRITEIAIINTDGIEVFETFSTLINPERNIPYPIEKLTGISNEMVHNAPKFYEVAKKIVEMTNGNIFVAHNVHFDYSFIQKEFSELGFQFQREKLCTVQTARKVLPGHKSYSLGKICADLGIEITDRHRALGDASATVELLKLIIQKEGSTKLYQTDSQNLAFPPYLDRKEYDQLPETPGVYYLYDKEDRLLYIGKSKNIKNRVKAHFKVTGNKSKEVEFKNNISHIDHTETGNELAALLLECHEIKTKRPLYNRALSKRRYPFAIKQQYDQDARIEFAIKSSINDEHNTIICGSRKGAQATINKIYARAFGLNTKDILHFESQIKLYQKTLSIEQYNQRLEVAYKSFDYPYENFSITLKGRTAFEKCFIDFENFQLKKIRFIRDNDAQELEIEENPDLKKIVLGYLIKSQSKIVKNDIQGI